MTIPQTADKLANVRYRRSRGDGMLLLMGETQRFFNLFRTQSCKKTKAYPETRTSSICVARTANSILTFKRHESPGQSP